MKRQKKHSAAQFEFGYSSNCFNLAQETAIEAPAPAPRQVDDKQTEIDKASYSMVPEVKAVTVRECHTVAGAMMDTPDCACTFWQQHVAASSWYRAEQECFVVLMLNTRRKLIAWTMCSMGTYDTILVHSIGVFRAAIVSNAPSIVLMHNHPSGDPSPSEADIRVTRDLVRGGELLKIQVLDHVIVGKATAERPKPYTSLRELGYFHFHQS